MFRAERLLRLAGDAAQPDGDLSNARHSALDSHSEAEAEDEEREASDDEDADQLPKPSLVSAALVLLLFLSILLVPPSIAVVALSLNPALRDALHRLQWGSPWLNLDTLSTTSITSIVPPFNLPSQPSTGLTPAAHPPSNQPHPPPVLPSTKADVVPSAPKAASAPAAVVEGPEVFMLAGQSNMQGYNWDNRDRLGQLNQWSNPGILQLGRFTGAGCYSADGDDNWRLLPATDPLEHHSAGPPVTSASGVGPGMSFAWAYQRLTGRNVTLVPCAFQGTSIEEWERTRFLYVDCVNRTNFVLRLGDGHRLGGILWLQGESNVQRSASPEYYLDRLSELIANFRRDVIGGETAPFVAAQMNADWITNSNVMYPLSHAIQRVYTELPWHVPYTAVVHSLDAHGLWLYGRGHDRSRDPIHFAASSARILGLRYARGVLAGRVNYPGQDRPGLIVQLFVPAQCYEEMMGVEAPAEGPSTPRTVCVVCWTPDPKAVSYRVRMWNDSLVHEYSTGNNASCTTVALTARMLAEHRQAWTVAVAGEGVTGETGEWSETGQWEVAVPTPPDLSSYPSAVPAPCLWLVADSLAGHVKDGELVAPDWMDVSGHRHVFTSFQPPRLVHPPYLNGHAAVRFAVNEWMVSETGFPVDTSAVSVVAVITVTGYNVFTPVLLLANQRYGQHHAFALLVDRRQVGVQDPNSGNLTIVPVVQNLSSAVIVSCIGTVESVRLFVNGALVVDGLPPVQPVAAVNASIELAGLLDHHDNHRFDGDIIELLVYDDSLSDSDHQLLVQSLRDKYSPPGG